MVKVAEHFLTENVANGVGVVAVRDEAAFLAATVVVTEALGHGVGGTVAVAPAGAVGVAAGLGSGLVAVAGARIVAATGLGGDEEGSETEDDSLELHVGGV